jgi:LPS-assembly protein
MRGGLVRILMVLAVLCGLAGGARAQGLPGAAAAGDQPVYYQAGSVEYDRERGVVTLTGQVEFWQGERVMLADKVTYDRNTGVAAAIGNVVLLEPDGQTVFADYAELSDGMKDGVMTGLRALLAQNARLAANGARRTDGRVAELSRAVYSTCDLCPEDPTRAPLWQLRARSAIQDKDNKRIEYHDAVVDFFGLPLLYTPFLAHPDPTERRASGILVPAFGYSKHLGVFAAVPYYWAIDDQSDATITPLLATTNGPALNLEYRRRFNNGEVTIDTSVANDDGDLAGHIFAKGLFAIDETWRWGFNLNRASSIDYMRDFRIQNWQPVLTSDVFAEGFGQGSYTRIEARVYQGLTSSVITKQLPVVLPYWQYSYAGERDRLGGRIGLDLDMFNVMRTEGTTTRRARMSAQWERPGVGLVGELWRLRLRLDSAAYSALQFNQQPNYGALTTASSAQAMPTMAVMWRWPLVRDAGTWGTQTIEPIAQVAMGPRSTSYLRDRTQIPNEDALDLALGFTDATLFSLNRFQGVDRLEGGGRAAVALRAAWDFPSGARLEALVGQSYRTAKDNAFPEESGLRNTTSDVVSRVTFAPTGWLDVTSRQRTSASTYQIRFADALASVGTDRFRVFGGYIYSVYNPYNLYQSPTSYTTALDTPRNEGTLGVSAKVGQFWRVSAFARRNLDTGEEVVNGMRAGYEDECFGFDVSLSRRYTSINNDNGATTLLFQFTFKTIGQFGFNAM